MIGTGKTILIVSVIALLWGCAAPAAKRPAIKDAILPEIDVVQVKEKSDEALKLAQEVKLDVTVLSNKIADIDSRVISLSEEISAVSAAKIEELETRLSLLTEAFKDLQVQIKAVEATALKASANRPGDPKFYPSSAANLLVPPEYDAYQAGLRLYNAKSFQKAKDAFNEMVQQFPSGKYVDNAYFWIGECNFSLSDYSAAIASFEKVISFPNSAKADDAQYKIGLSYLKMAQQGTAKEAFKKLVERYPSSEYAPRAEKYLRQLK